MLADLGYAVRRLLVQMRHEDAEVHALLMASAPNDPATPAAEQANVYATLTELNHFSDPSIPFAAQYGTEGQRFVDQGSPFATIYLLPLSHRTPESLDDTVSHLGSYLFHELTTPLGIRLEHVRRRRMPAAPRFRQPCRRRFAASARTPSGFRAVCSCAWPPAKPVTG